MLQLKRRLDVTSVEVAAARKAIEKETIADCDQILERLRNVESHRQSAIAHQVELVNEIAFELVQ